MKNIFFYKATHGIKENLKRTLAHVRSLIVSTTKNFFFVHLHFGVRFNCPSDRIILLDYAKLSVALGSSSWSKGNGYLLRKHGHFFGLKNSSRFPSIDSGQAYETVQHRISDHRYSRSVFAYALCNGFTSGKFELRTVSAETRLLVDELREFLAGCDESSLDLRIEIVESFDEYTDLYDHHFADYWSASEFTPLTKSALSRLLSSLHRNEAFICIGLWLRYLREQVSPDM